MDENRFKCRFPRCTASYQRKEHCRRHEAQHYRSQALKCTRCDQEFGRRDTLRRHMQKLHGVTQSAHVKVACTACRNQKARCEGGPPCRNCVRRGVTCSLQEDVQRQPWRPNSPVINNTQSVMSHGESTQRRGSCSRKSSRFIDLYFKLFHPYWPFVHQGSFREPQEAPLLIQSMTVIGLWLSDEKNAQPRAVALHNILSSAIHEQKNLWDASEVDDAGSSCSWPIPTYQAILLHLIFALLCNGEGLLGLDIKPRLSPGNANLLDKLARSCKNLGMFYYPNMLARYRESDLPGFVWVGIEEVKRFNTALYKVCRACSQQGSGPTDLGIAEAASRGVLAHDLQFPLPRNTPLWNAISTEEWESAATEDVHPLRLNDTLESEWVSNSALFLELNEE